MRYQKILVTGGSGRLGRYVTDILIKLCDLTVLDRVPTHLETRIIEADVTNYNALTGAFRTQEAIIHLAAIPNPRTAPADVTFQINVQGTWAMLQAAEDCGVKRVVVASSDAALGLHYNPPGWGPQYLPIDEDHPLRPVDFYSLSKECTESSSKSSFCVRPTLYFRPNFPNSKREVLTFRIIIFGPISLLRTSLRAFVALSIHPTEVTQPTSSQRKTVSTPARRLNCCASGTAGCRLSVMRPTLRPTHAPPFLTGVAPKIDLGSSRRSVGVT